jgi:hypothetical protein
MKVIVLLALSLVVLFSGGCGSDVTAVISTGSGIIVISSGSEPTIQNLQYSQDVAGHMVYGTVDFYAPDANLDVMTISVMDSRGYLRSRVVRDLAAFGGVISGRLPFSFGYAAYPPDIYTFTIFVSDWAGHSSNPVYGSFTVL